MFIPPVDTLWLSHSIVKHLFLLYIQLTSISDHVPLSTLLKNKRYLRRSRRNIISRIYHEFVRSRSKKLHCTNHANLVIVFLSCLLFNLFSFLSVFFLFFISFSRFDLFFRHSFIFFPSFCSIFQFFLFCFLSRFLPFVLFSSLFFSVLFF